MVNATFFANPEQLHAWMREHHATAKELFIGFHKKGSGRAGLDYTGAVLVALCFGWIDGVMRPLDDTSYALRFTRRKPRSVWSKVNIARVEALIERGLMQPAGMAAFEARTADRTGIYSFEQDEVAFTPRFEASFRANAPAWEKFEAQPPSYRRAATWHVMSAKRPDTRERRLATLIDLSARGERLPHLSRPSKPKGQP